MLYKLIYVFFTSNTNEDTHALFLAVAQVSVSVV